MDNQNHWFKFDADDINTHPDEASEIEMAFVNGSRVKGFSSSAGGIVCSHRGMLPPEKRILQNRWRYITP